MTNSASELVLVPPWEGSRDAGHADMLCGGNGTIYVNSKPFSQTNKYDEMYVYQS